MMASQPPLTFTPSCKGASTERVAGRAVRARHFDTNRRRTSPTAIGRRRPFFFVQASKVAPQRCGRIEGGVWPEASKLTNLVRAESISRALSGDGHIMASRTWLGRRPEGPRAEPLGNDLTPFLIADSGSVRGRAPNRAGGWQGEPGGAW